MNPLQTRLSPTRTTWRLERAGSGVLQGGGSDEGSWDRATAQAPGQAKDAAGHSSRASEIPSTPGLVHRNPDAQPRAVSCALQQ